MSPSSELAISKPYVHPLRSIRKTKHSQHLKIPELRGVLLSLSAEFGRSLRASAINPPTVTCTPAATP